MRKLLSRSAFVALVTVVVLAGSALAATSNVSITNFQFTPATDRVKLGDAVHWTNDTALTTHTSTSLGVGFGTVGLSLWDSGNIPPGGSFDRTFNIGGAFPYRCEIHHTMMGTISVADKAKPKSGLVGTKFSITVSLQASPPAGMVYDVQMAAPGGSFQDFATGITSRSVTFDSTGKPTGTYQFRSRLRRTSDGVASNFSRAIRVTVS